jgi:hypothetical protein
VSSGVDDVGNRVRAGGLLDVLQGSNSSNVVSSGDENLGSLFVLDNSVNFSTLEVELYNNFRMEC